MVRNSWWTIRSGAQIGLVVAVSAITLVWSAGAQVPDKVNIQGVLRNAAGELVNGTYTATFALYSSESGGTPLFQQTQTLGVVGGVFDAYIGPVSKDLFATNPSLFVGIKIGTDPELPRRPFVSTGYAFYAAQADAAKDLDCIGCVSGSEVATPLVVGGVVHSGSGGFKFPDGTVQVTAATSYWNASGSNIFNANTGDVGIGTNTNLHPGITVKSRVSGGHRGGLYFQGEGADTAFAGLYLNAANDFIVKTYGGPWADVLAVTRSGNLGVGTTTPARKIHLYGGTFKQETVGGWNWLEINRGGSDELYFGSGDTDRGIWSGGTRSFGFYTDTVPRLWIQQGTGNLGVGTTSPVSLVDSGPVVHVKGQGTKGGEFLVSDADNGRFLALFSGSSQFGAPPTIAYPSGHPLIVGNWNAIDGSGGFGERMRIAASGNVGIGTTNPTQKLEVAGVVFSSSGGFKFPDGTMQTTAGGPGYWSVSGLNLYNTTLGNVGIGTSTPVSLVDSGPMLHVKGSGIKGGEILVSDADNGRFLALFSGSSQYGAPPTIAYPATYPLILGTWSNIDGSGGFSEKARFDTAGNFGIGTPSPQARLHVAGGPVFLGIPIPPTGSPGPLLKVTNEWGVGHTDLIQVGFYFPGSIGDGTTRIHSWRRSDTISAPEHCPGKDPNVSPYDPNACYQYALNYLDISQGELYTPKNLMVGGNVGVGTTSPVTRLHIEGTTTNAGDNALRICAPGWNCNHFLHGTTGDVLLRSGSSSGKVVLQDTGGSVGIGTTNPTATVHVAGGVRIERDGGNQLSLKTSQWDWHLDVDTGADNKLRFRDMTSGTVPLTIDTAGNVGIGTSSPGAKLDVAGNEAFYSEYSNAQILAEAICTALKPGSGWTFAIRRECSDSAPSCASVCASLSEGQAGNLRCFNALHVYGNQPHSSTNQIGLKTYKYNSCDGSFCGPNYCCCGN